MSYNTGRIERMVKAGHSEDVIFQSICSDLQCKTNTPEMENIKIWLNRFVNGGELHPLPVELDQLANSKYQRMLNQGISSEKVDQQKFYDEFSTADEKKKEQLALLFVPQQGDTVGDEIKDRVLNDIDNQNISQSRQRAIDIKKEAIALRPAFLLSVVESVTDEEDTAPLILEKETTSAIQDSESQFYSFTGESYPEPEIKIEETIQFNGFQSSDVKSCIVREHLPERMYTYLNILTPEECSNLIKKLDFSEREENIQQNIVSKAIKAKQPLIRTNIRRNFIDEDVSRLVWDVVKVSLPPVLPDGRRLSGVRTKMNYYRYGVGQYFKTHIDGGYRFNASGDTAEYTFVIYLNDNFTGGTTRYCPLVDWNNEVREIKPIQGGMLVFRQYDMKHCGVTIVQGYKHILQGMVMYGPLKYDNLGAPIGKTPQGFKLTQCNCD